MAQILYSQRSLFTVISATADSFHVLIEKGDEREKVFMGRDTKNTTQIHVASFFLFFFSI